MAERALKERPYAGGGVAGEGLGEGAGAGGGGGEGSSNACCFEVAGSSNAPRFEVAGECRVVGVLGGELLPPWSEGSAGGVR